jgi:hypothetical protein
VGEELAAADPVGRINAALAGEFSGELASKDLQNRSL